MAGTEKSWFGFFLFLSTLNVGKMTYYDSIHIGGLFEHDFRNQELVFKYAVEKINARSDLLATTRLTYDLQQTPVQDSFHASKKVCEQVETGVAAIFGPMSDLSAAHVQSICEALEIPHVETRWDFRDSYHREFYSINLFPHYRTLSRAFIDLINHYKWTSFTILYENNDGLIRLQELLKAPADREYRVTIRRLEAPDDDFKPILKEIHSRSESHIVIDAHFTRVKNILRQALQMDMMSGYYHYLLTSLDLELVDLEDFKYGGCNITAFRLVDPENRHVQDVTSDWILEEMRTGRSPLESEKGIRVIIKLDFQIYVHQMPCQIDE